ESVRSSGRNGGDVLLERQPSRTELGGDRSRRKRCRIRPGIEKRRNCHTNCSGRRYTKRLLRSDLRRDPNRDGNVSITCLAKRGKPSFAGGLLCCLKKAGKQGSAGTTAAPSLAQLKNTTFDLCE